MNDTNKSVIILDNNCIALDETKCDNCDLEDVLICKFDLKIARLFVAGNTIYRIFAITILIFSGFIIGHWWMVGAYTGILILTFFIIEPRLLCSHCPYYEKEGKFLKCWALRGMPKLWKYRPEPISRWEKFLMFILGGFIDLFPFVGAIWGIVVFALDPSTYLHFGVTLIIITGLFTILVIVFGEILMSKNCKRCPNFSCGMNKVPNETIVKFLNKNPKMKEAWIKNGWKE
ncbi:MAG: hypothetical protein EAX90_12050 [Candidatus Heimdallarchaeota archaeon]|nr:hypothetical protein [Candidatus Heimdallarchaeota archaeon]